MMYAVTFTTTSITINLELARSIVLGTLHVIVETFQTFGRTRTSILPIILSLKIRNIIRNPLVLSKITTTTSPFSRRTRKPSEFPMTISMTTARIPTMCTQPKLVKPITTVLSYHTFPILEMKSSCTKITCYGINMNIV